jgi:hypothetical protein
MDEIKATVGEIVAHCKAKNIDVSETLAAFVARTIINENTTQFRMDKNMTEADIRELVRLGVDRLSEEDSPSLETIKMQVTFDTAYLQNEEKIEKSKSIHTKQLKEMQRAIIEVRPKSGSDFETLTSLYRQIFTFLLKHCASEMTGDRNVEREIAAALESVFPRIGLKSFVSMPADQKREQLNELANIVHGIRLFNQEIGKGGAGLDDTVNLAVSEVTALFHKLQGEVEELSEQCQQYTDVLIYAHHYKPENITSEMMTRWQEELINRRQYLSYCQSLQEDVMLSAQKTESHKDNYENEMTELKSMVGSRSSVPKEQVYPKFDTLSTLWQMLSAERKLVAAREATRHSLVAYKASFTPTLSAEYLQVVRDGHMPTADEEAHQAAGEPEVEFSADIPSNFGDPQGQAKGESIDDTDTSTEEAVRLSIESTPEFMQLPLEYQGYCPWTIVKRKGLLLPGNPALGVVRYKNTFNVFVHEEALQAFLKNPGPFTNGVLAEARRNPELIHLLRLQDRFPNASLNRIMGNAGNRTDGVHPLLGPEQPATADAATETPVHFVHKNVDPNYDWNEWSLRRKALKLAQLRKCRTVSTQTDSSHFRRENETQHYPARHHGTQTVTSRGTNPVRKKTYLAGVRGGGPNGSRFAKPHATDADLPVSTVVYEYET